MKNPNAKTSVVTAHKDGNRWRVVVELTWDVLPEDVQYRHHGDVESDYASRAFQRVREALNGLMGYVGLKKESDGVLAHYHVVEPTKRCHEFD
jgi:hypothetical protein